MVWRHLQTLATLATPVAMPVERLEGRLHGSDAAVAVTFAGTRATSDFVAGALMMVEQRSTLGILRSPFGLRHAASDRRWAAADLMVAEVPALWRLLLPGDTQWRMPAWVSQEIRGRDDSAIVLPAALRKEVDRLCRREGYVVEFFADTGAIRRFYARLYRPYVTARFGAGAVLVDEGRFTAVSRGMSLAILRAADEWVAGLLFRQTRGMLELGWFGSSSVPPRAGASEVLDASVVERAVAQGARRIVMGHSRPSLVDGVVRYKSRFGAVVGPARFPQRIIALRILRQTPALARALNAARFVAFRNGLPEIYETPVRQAP